MSTKIDITPFIPLAQEQERKYGIPTSITLAQIIQESSSKNGLSGLAKNFYNLFGVKADKDAKSGYVSLPSPEYENGKYTVKFSKFKVYDDYSESITDHSRVLLNDRYTNLTKTAITVEDYAKAIQKGGYATDPNYASNLINVIKDNDLNKYNVTFSKDGVNYSTFVNDLKNQQPIAGTPIQMISQMGKGLLGDYVEDKTKRTYKFVLEVVFILGILVLGVIFFTKTFGLSIPTTPLDLAGMAINKGGSNNG